MSLVLDIAKARFGRELPLDLREDLQSNEEALLSMSNGPAQICELVDAYVIANDAVKQEHSIMNNEQTVPIDRQEHTPGDKATEAILSMQPFKNRFPVVHQLKALGLDPAKWPELINDALV